MAERIVNVFDKVSVKGGTLRVPIYECQNHEIHLWRIKPEEWIYPHTHPHTDDIWYIIQGSGKYYSTANETHTVAAGDLAFASPEEVHGIYNSGAEDMIVLSVLAPLPVEYAEAPDFRYPDA